MKPTLVANALSIATVSFDISQEPTGLPENVLALLHEIATLIERYLEAGEEGTIDVFRLPMPANDRETLKHTLGTGEVEASVDALGRTHAQETGIPGVWWVSYFNTSSEVVAEFIEISAFPELFKAHQQDIRSGLKRLRKHLSPPAAP